MEEFELNEIQKLEAIELDPATTSTCRICKEGANIAKLIICPCRCAHNAYIHVNCLEIFVNTRNERCCSICQVRYPLEIRRKSLLECCRHINILFRKVWRPLCKLLLIFLCTICFTIILPLKSESYLCIYSVYKRVRRINFIIIVIIIIYFCCLLSYLYLIIKPVIKWSSSISYIYREWYKSTHELKLIEQYVSIKETEV